MQTVRRILLALVALLGLALTPSPAGAQAFEWIRQFGTGTNDQAHAIAVHSSGLYVTGRTFGPLPGQTHTGNWDIYVRKYDRGGHEVWTRQFGSPTAGIGLAIAAHDSGVYVAGQTHRALPGHTSAGDFDAFVRQYSLDGEEGWTDQFGGPLQDTVQGISVDDSGVYVAGLTWGALPGWINPGGDGIPDVFVRKYDLDGTAEWTHQFGTAELDAARGIALDDSGIYVSGATRGILPGQSSTSPEGVADAFVRKYDANGNELWTRQFGTSAADNASAISADASGIYVAGLTRDVLAGAESAGGADVFVRKYDADGHEIWTWQFGSSRDDLPLAISVHASGVYAAGQTSGTLPGQTSTSADDVPDAFVTRLRLDGEHVWTRQFGTASLEQATGVAADVSGIYLSGWTRGGALPGQTALGEDDAFVAKLVNLTPVQAIHQLIAQVVALNLRRGISTSLDAKLDAAVRVLEDVSNRNDAGATHTLQAFVYQVEAQRGVHISESDADLLIDAAREILAMLDE